MKRISEDAIMCCWSVFVLVLVCAVLALTMTVTHWESRLQGKMSAEYPLTRIDETTELTAEVNRRAVMRRQDPENSMEYWCMKQTWLLAERRR